MSGETLHPKEEDARAILTRINQLREVQGLSRLELEDISQFQQLRYARKVSGEWASRFKRVRRKPLKTPPIEGIRQLAAGKPYNITEQWLLEVFGQNHRASVPPRALDLLEKALIAGELQEQLDTLRKIQATRQIPVGTVVDEVSQANNEVEDGDADKEATHSAGAVAIETDKFKLSIEGSLPVFGTAPWVEAGQVADLVKIILELKADSLQVDPQQPAVVELNLTQFEEMTLLMLRTLIALRVQYSAKNVPKL